MQRTHCHGWWSEQEITKLKEKLCQCQKQRKKLAQWLVNESSFLHGQLKNMEAIHSGRLCHKEKQLEVASRTIEQLQRSLDEVQQMRDESGFQVCDKKIRYFSFLFSFSQFLSTNGDPS
jgi:predicted RNase H-like nuclease (RuvC/YqgF family)